MVEANEQKEIAKESREIAAKEKAEAVAAAAETVKDQAVADAAKKAAEKEIAEAKEVRTAVRVHWLYIKQRSALI
eukprot:SAG31_NODE_11098_length_1066_cov_1.292658_3_plen_75_part_00